jgi:hypothetical protein
MNPSSTSKYRNARKSSKTDKDLADNTWSLVVTSLSSSSEHGRRRKSSKTNIDSSSSEHGKGRKSSKSNKRLADNTWSLADMGLSSSSEHRRNPDKGLGRLDTRSKGIIKKPGFVDLGNDMPDLCLSSSSEHGGRRKAIRGRKDLIKKLESANLGQFSSPEQGSVKKRSSAPRLADVSLSSSSEHGKGRKSSKSNKGLADNAWSLADMSLSSSSEHRSKLSSKGSDKLDRSSLLGLSSSSEHRQRKKSPKARKNPLQEKYFVAKLGSHELTVAFRRPEETTNEKVAHQRN